MKLLVHLSLLLSFAAPAAVAESISPQASLETSAQHDARMEWWREARFGMFVHWGLYSGLAGTWESKPVGSKVNMEWTQQWAGVDTDTYAKAAKPKFMPKPGFATQWAKLAKAAGCKYVVFTTKHHEGFALHDSKFSDYDAKDFLDRDLVKEIVDALHAEGLKVGFYHSLIDWHHPQYDFKQAEGLPFPAQGAKLATAPRDQTKYIEFLHHQVGELISNYGPVDVIWFDYSSPKFDGDRAWGASSLVKAIKAKQPNIIINNRLYNRKDSGVASTSGQTNTFNPAYGDFSTPEQHIPATGMNGLDWESCMTLNNTWGYSEHDHNWKSSEKLIRNLIDIASKGGNYLLNIGPKGDGCVPAESIERLEAMGEWMKKNGAAIYGTQASPLEKTPFDGRITRKEKTLYLHVFSRPQDGKIVLPMKLSQASLLDGGAKLDLQNEGESSTISLPEKLSDPVATVIQIDR